MQSKVVASAVQHQPVELGGIDENLAFILNQMQLEASNGSDLVVFPEANLTSFFKHEEGGLKRLWNEGSVDVDGPELNAIVEAAKPLASIPLSVSTNVRRWLAPSITARP